jgi:hypothetical protein
LIQQKKQWLKLINSSLSEYIEYLEHIEYLIKDFRYGAQDDQEAQVNQEASLLTITHDNLNLTPLHRYCGK